MWGFLFNQMNRHKEGLDSNDKIVYFSGVVAAEEVALIEEHQISYQQIKALERYGFNNIARNKFALMRADELMAIGSDIATDSLAGILVDSDSNLTSEVLAYYQILAGNEVWRNLLQQLELAPSVRRFGIMRLLTFNGFSQQIAKPSQIKGRT